MTRINNLFAAFLLPAACSTAMTQPFNSAPDYGDPQAYLQAGPQSTLNVGQAAWVKEKLGILGNDSLEDIGRIFHWIKENFERNAAGGMLVGKTTAAQLLQTRQLSGCHDWGLILAALLRYAGYPAIMVDAAGLSWARNFNPKQSAQQMYSGHIFVEVFTQGHWILVNSTSGRYAADYDPENPVIPMTAGPETEGYYVLYKGLDPASYGIKNIERLHAAMRRFAIRLHSLQIELPQCQILQLPAPEEETPADTE
ncbi:MAG: hypothetical protein HY747_10185 [Elusimicrobia bacterium]|nr:hypothetical protein [Elusimicrobiota bacterium]